MGREWKAPNKSEQVEDEQSTDPEPDLVEHRMVADNRIIEPPDWERGAGELCASNMSSEKGSELKRQLPSLLHLVKKRMPVICVSKGVHHLDILDDSALELPHLCLGRVFLLVPFQACFHDRKEAHIPECEVVLTTGMVEVPDALKAHAEEPEVQGHEREPSRNRCTEVPEGAAEQVLPPLRG